jgi:hypothetical protein
MTFGYAKRAQALRLQGLRTTMSDRGSDGRAIVRLIAAVAFAAAAMAGIFSQDNEEGYRLLFTLPLAFGTLLVACRTVQTHIRHTSVAMLVAAMAFRYVLAPTITVWSRSYGAALTIDPFQESIGRAVILMLYEMACLFAVLAVIGRRLLRNGGSLAVPIIRRFRAPRRQLMAPLLVACAVGVLILVPEARANYRFFTGVVQDHDASAGVRSGGTGFLVLIVEWARLSLGVFVANWCYRAYLSKRSPLYVVLSLVAFLPLLVIVARTSRDGIVFPAIAAILLLTHLYPSSRRRIAMVFGCLLVSTVITITAAKNFGASHEVGAPQDEQFKIARFIQAYASPPHTVGIAVETAAALHGRVSTFELVSTDSLSNVPLLGRTLGLGPSTTVYFNLEAYGREFAMDQLLPMIGQGYIHWGFLLSPIYSVLIILLAFWLDGRTAGGARPELYYVNTFIVARLAASSALGNWTTSLDVLITMWAPLCVIFWMNGHTEQSPRARADRRCLAGSLSAPQRPVVSSH